MTLTCTVHEAIQDAATTPTSLAHTITGPQKPGDLYIVAFTNGGGQTWGIPSGWTSIYSTANGPEATSGSAAFYNTVEGTGTIANPSWTWGTANSYISTLFRVRSSLENGACRVVQTQNSVNAVDNAASYTTTSITVTSGNLVVYGVCSEGGATANTYSQAHGDTEITDRNNGGGTPEHTAAYTATGLSGAITRTMTPSTANQVAGMTWIVEVREVPVQNLIVPQAVNRASRW